MTDDLRTAIDLLKRGKKIAYRQGYEPGETTEEWQQAVDTFLGSLRARLKFERENRKAKEQR